MILCDLPYGTTRNKWDVIIPLEPLWAQYRRIIKSNGVIALHSDMPFTAALVSAGKDLYRYELIWVKENGSDFLNANRKPLKVHESIQIFFDILPTAKAGGFLHQPPLRSNRGCCSPFNTCTNCKHYSLSLTTPYIPIAKTRGFTAQYDKTAISRIKEAQDNGKQGNQKKQPDHD